MLETGSLSAAGRAMGMTQPTVGRHIDSLEAALQLKLFTRSFDGFAPTDAALELQALRRRRWPPPPRRCAASASSQGDGVRGTVRLTASEVVGVEVLPPILTALRRQHPALVIELVLSNRGGRPAAPRSRHRRAHGARRRRTRWWRSASAASSWACTRTSDYLAEHGTPAHGGRAAGATR